MSYSTALHAATTHQQDLVLPYVQDLRSVVDMDAIRAAKLDLAVDPLGGASLPYWEAINSVYGLNIDIVNPEIDPAFSFVPRDFDGVTRMDCTSRCTTVNLVRVQYRYGVAFANDPAAARHGVVTPGVGLMHPQHYLAVALRYLMESRQGWGKALIVGKSFTGTELMNRIARKFGHRVWEMPAGFDSFCPVLTTGECCYAAEEGAATFLCRDSTTWTTSKDGLIMALVAAELKAWTAKDPGEHFRELTAEFGTPYYTRTRIPATTEQKQALSTLDAVEAMQLAGEPVVDVFTRSPGNNAPLNGLKIITANGWFAAHAPPTGDSYEIYAESFRDETHLLALMEEGREIVDHALKQ